MYRRAMPVSRVSVVALAQCCVYVCVSVPSRVRCAGAGDAKLGEDHRWQDLQAGRLDHVTQYETTVPQWLMPSRYRRSTSSSEHPTRAAIRITAEGEELILQLEKNEQLFSPAYTEAWYSPDGVRHSRSPPPTEHCFYHGTVRGQEGSGVALSTCQGLRGLIAVNNSRSFLIEPLPGALQPDRHALYRTESLRVREGGTCGHGGGLDDIIAGLGHWRGREKRDISQNMKYVELLVVADYAEFQKHNRDYEKTKMKLLEAANYVDKYYRALSIRVALIGLEVWNDTDKIAVSENPYSTLGAFLAWRRKQLGRLSNDNAQLVTGVSFQGTTIGLAPLKAMCSEYQSGGVNSDHSNSAVGVAATMAHEMGHNFGMNHDTDGCCSARPEDGGCIMASATGHPFPRVFNPCNRKELERYLGSGGGKCLFNPPDTSTIYGGRRCGNGYLEEGEECDCGEVEECSSPCCNAHNCTLRAGAECAHGVCCDNCKLKSPGVLCREPSGSCDLPEYCDGKSESCPANFYLMDGTSCAGGQAYCYTGMCLTLEQQCLSLWGPGAQPAPDQCFERVNAAGDTYGNCGKDLMGQYRKCASRHSKCGKIQCQSPVSKPVETNAVAIDTTITINGRPVRCRGTHVYRSSQGVENMGDTLDPGLVMTGTKCGEQEICFEGECRNSSFLQADECNAKCSGHGFCNNNHNCHCKPGWAPPICDQPGAGGSVDSGPIITHSSLLPVFLLLPLFLALGLAAVGLWCCYKHRLHPLKKSSAPPLGAQPTSASAPPDEKSVGSGHTNPTFRLKGKDAHRLGAPPPSPACPPRQRSHIVRPNVSPPPVPSLARHTPPPKPAAISTPPPCRPPPSASCRTPPRQGPPSRPPPPCPVPRPGQELPNKHRPPVPTTTPSTLPKRCLMTHAGNTQKLRFQLENNSSS